MGSVKPSSTPPPRGPPLSSTPELSDRAWAVLTACTAGLSSLVKPPLAAIGVAFGAVPAPVLYAAAALLLVTLCACLAVAAAQAGRGGDDATLEQVRLGGRAAYADFPTRAFTRKSLATYAASEGAKTDLRAALTDATVTTDRCALLGNLHVLGASRAYAFPFDPKGAPESASHCLVTADALQFAVLAGARAVDLDVWPDTQDGAAGGPVVAVMDPAQPWRRLSLNALPLRVLLDALAAAAFRDGSNPQRGDPFLLLLRFHGAPTAYTYERAAFALKSALGRYCLDPAAYGKFCRDDATKLAQLPLASAMGKVVVLASTPAAFPPPAAFLEYVNAGVHEVTPAEVALAAATPVARGAMAQSFTQNLPKFAVGWCETAADAATARSCGVHVVAMNPWSSAGLQAHRAFFGDYSWHYKQRQEGDESPLLFPAVDQRVQLPSPEQDASGGHPAPLGGPPPQP